VNDIHLFVPTFDIDACLEAVRRCLEKGWTGLGDQTIAFERAFCAATGHAHAHFLNSATAGLHLAVKILKDANGWCDGDEIITTPITFVSTNHAILYEGLTPVFADVDKYLSLDPASVAERIGPRTRAVLFVGLGGNTGAWPEIVSLCRERGLAVILDAAHLTGTRLDGVAPGLAADAAVYSFQAVKNLPTADSGMVCFAEGQHDAEARKLSWLGIDKDTYSRTVGDGRYKWKYEVDAVGYKYHGNSIMAAIGLAQLDALERDNAYRRGLCDLYQSRLAGQAGIEIVPTAPGCVSSRHLFQVLVDNRDEVMLALNERRIFPGVHYRDNTEYAVYRDARGPCPRARSASLRVISLPLHLRLDADDIERVCGALVEAVATVGPERTPPHQP
jgi:dTDP-4-amino-4,6-dideoxygalactose transaminase